MIAKLLRQIDDGPFPFLGLTNRATRRNTYISDDRLTAFLSTYMD